MIQLPVAIGLTVCEQLIVEERTRNITLVNCLARLRVQKVPSTPQRLVIYARLTDGLGDGKITLKVLHPNTLEELLKQDTRAKFSHPLQEFNAIFRGSFSFPVEGRYQINLLADGEFIAQRVLEVFVKKETP
jgi:hypothetical protein